MNHFDVTMIVAAHGTSTDILTFANSPGNIEYEAMGGVPYLHKRTRCHRRKHGAPFKKTLGSVPPIPTPWEGLHELAQ